MNLKFHAIHQLFIEQLEALDIRFMINDIYPEELCRFQPVVPAMMQLILAKPRSETELEQQKKFHRFHHKMWKDKTSAWADFVKSDDFDERMVTNSFNNHHATVITVTLLDTLDFEQQYAQRTPVVIQGTSLPFLPNQITPELDESTIAIAQSIEPEFSKILSALEMFKAPYLVMNEQPLSKEHPRLKLWTNIEESAAEQARKANDYCTGNAGSLSEWMSEHAGVVQSGCHWITHHNQCDFNSFYGEREEVNINGVVVSILPHKFITMKFD